MRGWLDFDPEFPTIALLACLLIAGVLAGLVLMATFKSFPCSDPDLWAQRGATPTDCIMTPAWMSEYLRDRQILLHTPPH